ncbi:MAG: sporulation protein YunB [Oscillibacter sp.]|nr:sporulation protein YunB [Oscillibacter sp.]MBQ8852022.1 sporulation protein YunB [Oscillibacter sp.]
MKRGFFAYRRYWGRRSALKTVGFLLFCTLLAVVIYASAQMRPLLERMAVTRVENTVNRIVSEAVDESITSGKLSYDRLISFEKDTEGRITAVHSNMAAFNQLQAEILDIVLARIEQVSARELAIPIGSLTGSPILAGRGPRIQVRMESIGSSSAQFRNQFETGGINQTRHQIILEIDVSISILLPGFTTATKVSNAVTVAETVIVGSVPESYTYFHTTDTDYVEDAKDHVLNG